MAAHRSLHRLCSECGTPLESDSPVAKTCSDKCRSRRSKRLRRERGELPPVNPDQSKTPALLKPHQAALRDRIDGRTDDAIHEELSKALGPVVREAITDDVLRSIQSAVGLVPSALTAIAEDLAGDDLPLRHRAAQLLLKYTLGNAAVAPTEEATEGKQIIVQFEGMSRPESHAPDPPDVVEAEATEVLPLDENTQNECERCHETKPLSDFVEASDCCQACFDKQQEQMKKLNEELA